MSRKGSQPVQQRKKVDPFHCGTITVEDQRRMRKAGERADRIASGLTRPIGTGAHWKGKKGENRANRRSARQEARNATRGDY